MSQEPTKDERNDTATPSTEAPSGGYSQAPVSRARARISGCPPCRGDCRQGRLCDAEQRPPRGYGVALAAIVGLALLAACVVMVLK